MTRSSRYLVICLDNAGYEVSLERCKLHVAIRDAAAEQMGQVRVIDESGAEYLYPAERFVDASLTSTVRRAVLQVI